MKRLVICSLLAFGLIISGGCTQKDDSSDTGSKTQQEAKNQEESQEVSKDYIKDVTTKAEQIDKDISSLEKEEMSIESEKEGFEPQIITIWSSDKKPVKITRTEADDMGIMDGLSSFYFEDGNLILMKAPFSNHIFKNDKMVFWLDENMEILEIPENDMNSADESILNSISEMLELFDKDSNSISMIKFESKEMDFSNLSYIVSEKIKDENLEKAIGKALDYDKKSDGPIRYYYNKIDLNDDKKEEIFVYLVGSYVSGSGGSTAMIFEQNDKNYKLISKFTLVRNPIAISENKTNGYKDIIMEVSGGGIESFYAELKFDGKTYPSNPSVAPALKNGTKLEGLCIVADDISKNMGIEIN